MAQIGSWQSGQNSILSGVRSDPHEKQAIIDAITNPPASDYGSPRPKSVPMDTEQSDHNQQCLLVVCLVVSKCAMLAT